MTSTTGARVDPVDWRDVGQLMALPPLAFFTSRWSVPVLVVVEAVVLRVVDPALVGRLLEGQGPMVAVVVIASLATRSAAEVTLALRDSRLAAARAEAAAASAVAARNARLDWVTEVAGPTLTTLSEPRPLDDADRLTCRLLEARIRDALRAPGLTGEPLDSVVTEARRMGVDVVLLDDGAVTDPEKAARLRELVADLVAGHEGERVIARITPPGRAEVATVVFTDRDGGADRRVVTAEDLDPGGSGPGPDF